LKKFLNTATETLTEPAQGILEEVGGGSPVEETVTGEGLSRRVNELLGGLVGGAAFSVGGEKARDNIKKGEAIANQAINELGDAGVPEAAARIDAEAQLDPTDKQVLEEVK